MNVIVVLKQFQLMISQLKRKLINDYYDDQFIFKVIYPGKKPNNDHFILSNVRICCVFVSYNCKLNTFGFWTGWTELLRSHQLKEII